ncbi:hypothetical protein Tco_0509529 [Tanacetum coccineum]
MGMLVSVRQDGGRRVENNGDDGGGDLRWSHGVWWLMQQNDARWRSRRQALMSLRISIPEGLDNTTTATAEELEGE